MTKDLEETLNGLGPGYRAVVDRLVAGAEAEIAPGRRAYAFTPRRFAHMRPMLAAASLLVVVGLAALLLRTGGPGAAGVSGFDPAAAAAHEYRLAEVCDGQSVDEMIRTQNADGSWRNDFLTRRNAAALAKCSGVEAKVAYKKAMRNLRVRGLL